MVIQAIYPKPRTSTPDKGNKSYPYLLREVQVKRPNQVWAADITYIPMAGGVVFKISLQEFALSGQEQIRRERRLGDINTEDYLICGHSLSQPKSLRSMAVTEAGLPNSFQARKLMSKPTIPRRRPD